LEAAGVLDSEKNTEGVPNLATRNAFVIAQVASAGQRLPPRRKKYIAVLAPIVLGKTPISITYLKIRT
jgi:hypothetical protein